MSHAYLHSKSPTSAEKIDDALCQVGVPIVQSAMTTFLAVVSLYFIPSYIFWVFVVCVTLVVVFGAFHGLIFLPVLFSTFVSPGVFAAGSLDQHGDGDDGLRRSRTMEISMEVIDEERSGPYPAAGDRDGGAANLTRRHSAA